MRLKEDTRFCSGKSVADLIVIVFRILDALNCNELFWPSFFFRPISSVPKGFTVDKPDSDFD